MTTPLTTPPSQWQQTTTRRFLRWLFSWRTARRALIGLACLVTMWALFCAEENTRGKRAWERYRREAEARGEELDWNTYIPKPIPDDQNFAATPVIQSWFVRSNYIFTSSKYWENDNYGRVSAAVSSSRDRKDGGNRHFTDLVAWESAFDAIHTGQVGRSQSFESDKFHLESRSHAAPSVLDGLRTNEAVFSELRAASQRPYSRYPVDYHLEDPYTSLLPHLNDVRQVCRRLQLKACAELAAGRSAEALADVNLMLCLADSVKEEPFLISYLVRVACLQTAIEPVWEGLAEHRWSDAQLQEIQTRLQSYNFIADLKQPFDAERAEGIVIIDFVRKRGLGILTDIVGPWDWTPSNNSIANLCRRLFVPSGWLYLEQVNYCRLFEIQSGGTIDLANRRVSPSRIKSNTAAVEREFGGGASSVSRFMHHRVIAAMLLPALGNIPRKGGAAQVVVDQAALACALERYRLANGQFPEALDALVPRFISQLPHDVITGDPYKYRRTDDGQFILYSVGWNEKDDGGLPGKTLFDSEEGDWVWQYPALQ